STQKGELGAIQEGSQFTTPPVIDPSAVNQYSLIKTESGSWYRPLGEDEPPRISNWRFDKNRGTVSGTVIGDQAIRDGFPFTTSLLKDPESGSKRGYIADRPERSHQLGLQLTPPKTSNVNAAFEVRGRQRRRRERRLTPLQRTTDRGWPGPPGTPAGNVTRYAALGSLD
ncbi:hypothetical protein THAOC_05662, partial [Thalassiosira oceanica]